MKRSAYWIWIGAIAGLFVVPPDAQAGDVVATAVYSKTVNGYKRVKLADGTYKPETYVLTDGGLLPGTTRDNVQEKMSFITIARVLEKFLAAQNYIMADDESSAQQLLVVHWGRTIAYDDISNSVRMGSAGQASAAFAGATADLNRNATGSQGASAAQGASDAAAASAAANQYESEMTLLYMQNQMRDRGNEENARLLGYKRDMDESNDARRQFMVTNYYNELLSEIEQPRYFVVVSAFALPLPKVQAEQKLLWTTRVSMRSAGKSFEKYLPDMIARASRLVGRDTRHLVREFDGQVELGELKVMGIEEETEAAPKTTDTPDDK